MLCKTNKAPFWNEGYISSRKEILPTYALPLEQARFSWLGVAR